VRLAGWFEISPTLALILAAAYPIGAFMADVFDNRKAFLTPLLGPIERALYRLAGVDPEAEQKWVEYALSMIVFGGGCLLALYALLWLTVPPRELCRRPDIGRAALPGLTAKRSATLPFPYRRWITGIGGEAIDSPCG
jgi:Potassium-transporting ATPase A subunit